jgi:hypothetical protein
MLVAATFMPKVPRWILNFEAGEEEQSEARRAFVEPYDVVPPAQIVVERVVSPPLPQSPYWSESSAAAWGQRYAAYRRSWGCAPVSAPTISGLVEACPGFAAPRMQ